MRHNREESPNGIYHVTQRGEGKQILFEEKDDYVKFINIVAVAKRQYKFELLAACLMRNHVHLLIKTGNVTELSYIMHSIGTRYAKYYNEKYLHIGSVFQGRYKSKPVRDESYLLACVQYIHNNPQAAGVAARENYAWSSYGNYLGKSGAFDSLIDVDAVLGLLGDVGGFVEFSGLCETEAVAPDESEVGDELIAEAKRIVRRHCGRDFENNLMIKQLRKEDRDTIIRKMKDAGISNKRIELVTGVSRDIIRRL